MSSIVAIVGRPNVGKSSIFNLLTGSRTALVANFSGLTRDRQYGKAKRSSAILIDTGGISSDRSNFAKEVLSQTESAIKEADILFFIVDAKEGLLGLDREISIKLRKTNKPIYLIVNKADNQTDRDFNPEFNELGLNNIFLVSAAHNSGLGEISDLLSDLSPTENLFLKENSNELRVSLIGRPNVGKSTLINKLSGQKRVLVSAESGTTRDSIEVPLKSKDKGIILIDTAGIRKKSSVTKKAEKFSVMQSLEAVKRSQVVILLIDSEEPLVDQDLHLLGLSLSLGRPVVIAPNKVDLLNKNQKDVLKVLIKRKLNFAEFISVHLISAKNGSGVKSLLKLAKEAYISSTKELETSFLNKILSKAIQHQPPPMVGRFRPKLRYIHQGGKNPPILVIHGNNLNKVKTSYKKYLENFFRDKLKLSSTPLVIEFLESDNPFKGKKNKLTKKQKMKRSRVVRRSKK